MGRLDYHHTHHPTFGSRKLVVLLRQEGYDIGRKLVRRLMQEMGLYTIYPKENLSKRNFKEAIVPYLLRNRQILHSVQWFYRKSEKEFPISSTKSMTKSLSATKPSP